MTIRSIRGGVDPVAWTDPTAVVIAQAIQAAEDERAASRVAQRAAQEARSRAADQEIAAMHAAADERMIAGILQGAGTIASGVCEAFEGGFQVEQASQQGQVGEASGDGATNPTGCEPERNDSAAHWMIGFRAARRATEGGVKVASSVFEANAARNDAHARSYAEAREVAGSRADECREDADRAQRLRDRAIETLDQIVQARRQAEQAALRA
jgi:hypothetical protein